jgi:hypothetical protein
VVSVPRDVGVASPSLVPVTVKGAPAPSANAQVLWGGSTDGGLFHQDRVAVVNGRLPDANRADEVAMTRTAARALGVHVGQVMRLGLFSNQSSGTASFRVNVTVVGFVVLNNQVVQDDVDATYGFALVTPALMREIAAVSPMSVIPSTYELQLVNGARDVSRLEQELVALVPRGASYQFHAAAPVVARVEEAVKPESIALAVFGGIAALVALVVAGQSLSRQLRTGDEDRQVLRALGAAPSATMADGLIGVVGAVVVGSALAVAVAVGISPVAPLGPVRPVYPGAGIAFDWTVLGLGLGGLIVVLCAVAVVVAYRQAPHRLARRRQRTRARGSRTAHVAANAGFSVPAVTGIRFAFEPGSGRAAVPVRSALVGTGIRNGDGRRDPDVREWAVHTRFPSAPLRVELDVRAQPEQRGPTQRPDASQPRPRRRRLGRGRLHRR